jgi:cytochrome c biogenesis protein CcmG, thiol:disulfide interchange protein DsbE
VSRSTLGAVTRTSVPLVAGLALALVALLVYGVLSVGESTTLDDAVKAGERPAAPARSLPALDGGSGSLADWRGKPVVLNFWASWCAPCADEAPALKRAQAQLEKAGGTVLGVTVSDATSDSRAFMRKHGIAFPSLRDVEDELGEDYGRTGVPETFVIDREGRIAARRRGPVDEAWLDATLPPVLAEQA